MASSFDKHVFISYSHLDNQTDTPGKDGWVSHLEKTLYGQLSTRLGERAKIWRDPTLRGNEDFSDEIVGQFSSAALLVSVLSPGYLSSLWCKKELREFCTAAEKSSGLKIGNKYRVLKIVKLPVEREMQDTLHPDMSRMLGYEFYTGGKEETAIELDPEFPDNAQLYRVKVAMLAQDIADLIRQLIEDTGGAAFMKTQPPPRGSVYLAECSYDRKDDRSFLAAELKARGYKVLPEEHHLAGEKTIYAAEVSRCLEGSRLSIHLIGKGYGAVPDGPGDQKSVVVMQNELAIARSREAGLPRIIWLPEGTTPDNEQQKEFIASLLGNANTQFGADLITGGFESLKETVLATLKKLEAPAPKVIEQGPGAPKLIHIVCDERDREATIPLRKFLKSRGFQARIPVFHGEAGEVREANEQSLRDCHAVLVFYGAGEETWKRAVDGELLKLPGYRPGKAPPAVYTYLSGPVTPEKTELLELESDVLNGLDGFSEASLDPMLAKLESIE